MKKLIGLVLVSALLVFNSTSFAYDGVSANLTSGRTVVSSAGTAVQVTSASTPCQRVVITAETDNTGVIVVGGSAVIASLSTRRGIPLAAGNSITIPVNNLNKIYIDSTVSGDGVTWLYFAN